MPDRLYTPTELAARLGVSARTVERWCSRDGMPCERRGRRRRIDLNAARGWLEVHRFAWVDLPDCEQWGIVYLILGSGLP